MSLPEKVTCSLKYNHGQHVARLTMKTTDYAMSLGINNLNGSGWFYLFEDLPIETNAVEPWLESIYFTLGESNPKLGEQNWELLLTHVGKLANDIHNKQLRLAKLMQASKKQIGKS